MWAILKIMHPLVVGNLSQNFTEALKAVYVPPPAWLSYRAKADASMTGTITGYSIAPVSIQATNNNAAPIAGATGLTITVSVNYTNNANKKIEFYAVISSIC